MAHWNIDPDLEEDEDEAESTSTRRNTRLMDTHVRPLALHKCPKCGHYYANMFFTDTSRTCLLCQHEASHPLVPARQTAKV